jgi:glutamate dehydrogenase/leucine dehydrogenase
MDSIGSQLSCTVKRGGEVLGYVAIDSTIGGRSCGGLRMLQDVDEAEIADLARAMTLKYGFLGLPQGGAKAGVRGDPEASAEVRREHLLAYGQAIAPLLRSRVYIPHPDMGTDNTTIRYLLGSVGIKVKPRELRGTDSGYYTALTVMAGIKQGSLHVGLDLSRSSVAIEGFGKVGGALGGLLAAAQIRVVAVSTSRGALFNPRGLDMKLVSALANEMGSRFVEAYQDAEHLARIALLELPVDVLCPCARHGSVHADNAPRIAAKLISPGANNPVTPEAERILEERSVLCLPDFVTNSGGVLGGTMEFANHIRETIEMFIDQRIGARIARLLEEAAQQKTPLRALAERDSNHRFARMQRAAAHPTLKGRLLEAGLECHRRGWVPGPLMRRLSMPYFVKRAGTP